MSTEHDTVSAKPKAAIAAEEVNPAFRYLGIPRSVFSWRPRLPSRNWSIFWAATISVSSYYVYDRRQCRKIRESYIDKVKWIGEQPCNPSDLPRRVSVLATATWDDGDEGRGVTWFKRYVKPLFIASAVDFQIRFGRGPGDLSRQLVEKIRERRLTDAAEATSRLPDHELNVSELRRRREKEIEKDGGVAIIGRQALKEYFWALRRGWSETIDLDAEGKLRGLLGSDDAKEMAQEKLVQELEREDAGRGPFDEDYSLADGGDGFNNSEGGLTPPTASRTIPPPAVLPEQPPIIVFPYSQPVGMRFWPYKIWRFFNRRRDAEAGGELALALIYGETESLAPPQVPKAVLDEEEVRQVKLGIKTDEDLDLSPENGLTGSPTLDYLHDPVETTYTRSTFVSLPKNIKKAKQEYYEKTLSKAVKIARELSRGEREPTKEEMKYPPPTEPELRQERVDKERKWRNDLEGWAIGRPGSGVAWDWERWSDLKVFRPSSLQPPTRPSEVD